MDDLSRAEKYLFILAALLIIFAFYKGSTAVGQTAGTQAVDILQAAQGRTSSGAFPAYPA